MDVAEAGSFFLEGFRAAVAAAARSERDHIIVAYSRKAFLQTGAPGNMAHQIILEDANPLSIFYSTC